MESTTTVESSATRSPCSLIVSIFKLQRDRMHVLMGAIWLSAMQWLPKLPVQ